MKDSDPPRVSLRSFAFWSALGLLGLVLAVSIALVARDLADQPVGLANEPVSAGRALDPPGSPPSGTGSGGTGAGQGGSDRKGGGDGGRSHDGRPDGSSSDDSGPHSGGSDDRHEVEDEDHDDDDD